MFSTLRAGLFHLLSGDDHGVPRWVEELQTGDDEGYFGPASAVWSVHGGIPVLVAGMRALLLQTLHPGAMAGVHDWSRYREDPLGRLNGTVRWVLVTTFGDRRQAERACTHVGKLHERVKGSYERDGEPVDYSAADPALLSWVHVAFTDSFLRCHEIWGGSIPGSADTYVAEWAAAGELLGVSRPPTSERELADQLAAFDPELRRDPRAQDALRFLRKPPLERTTGFGYRIIFAGAVASLPVKYRRLLGVRRVWWPALTATRVLLWFVARILGRPSQSELYARRRIDRLAVNARA
jgi:uncharacterized protein (DUF2236 family)